MEVQKQLICDAANLPQVRRLPASSVTLNELGPCQQASVVELPSTPWWHCQELWLHMVPSNGH